MSFTDSRELGTLVEVDSLTRPNWEVRRYELTPGEHTVRLTVNAGISLADLTITFSVAAGKECQIVAAVANPEEKSATVSVTVRDKATGQDIPRDVRLLNLSQPPGSERGYQDAERAAVNRACLTGCPRPEHVAESPPSGE